MDILQVDALSGSAPDQFVQSCRDTGFAVVSNHGIEKSLIEKVYQDWRQFFDSPSKFDFHFRPESQAGYFPFRSENAKGSAVKDLKEFYHLYPQQALPPQLSNATIELRDQLLVLGQKLLGWLDRATPEPIRKEFSQPLASMAEDSSLNLFRVIHYPPLTGSEEVGAIRAAAHEDINLITLLPASTEMGLEVLGANSEWFAVPGGFGDLVINVGDMLQEASQGYFRSTTHRVVNPAGEAAAKPRYSMPLFVHPRPEVRLSSRHTAESYLTERLKEIGLK
jgi:isopenicillin N synthase-like dioxygenase